MGLNLRKTIEDYLVNVGWKKDPTAKENNYGVLRNYISPLNGNLLSFYEAIWEQELIEMNPLAIGEKKVSDGQR